VCAGPELHHLVGFLGQGRQMMTGTPAVHVVDYDASCRKAISRLLKLSSGDIAEHDSATRLLRAIGKCQTALHRPRRKHAGDEAFKTHLDGYNFLPFLKG
jgi:hypothetical protein